MASRKPVIGLSGGIGAGKSSVAAEFAARSCTVIDSDRLNRQVLARPEVAATLRSWWGDRVVAADEGLKTGEIARIIFADEKERERLESLTHPLIAELRQGIILVAVEDPAVRAIILDSPLLFENSLDRLCDAVVFVDCPAALRHSRLHRERGWDVEQVSARERWQLSPEEKRRRSSFVVVNSGAPGDLGPQVAAILERMISESPARQ